MTRASAPPNLLQLQKADTASARVAALRTLKNELIGHDQRKEHYIVAGIVPLLAQQLASQWPGPTGESSDGLAPARTDQNSDELEVYLQTIYVVGSLAQGGPTFLAPIFASDILPNLLATLSSPDCPPSFRLPILRLLNTIADRIPLLSQDQGPQDTRLADLVFASEPIGAIRRIIAQDYANHGSQACIELAAALIGKLCTEEAHKTTLAENGVLDALSIKVASFVVAQGYVLPGAENYVQEPGALGQMPPPAPESARLAPILRAVTVIIEQSKWRAGHFLSSPGLVTVFPKQDPGFAASDIKRGPWGGTGYAFAFCPACEHEVAGLIGLPALIGSISPQHGRHSQSRTSPSFPIQPAAEDDENSVIPWLLCLVRSESGMLRLMAARLVTALFRLGLAKKHRVPMFSYLLVPILLRMLDKDFELMDEPVSFGDGLITPTQRLKEEAPAVLANLVMDDQELQRHAVEGNALKRLSQLLKETYNPVPECQRPMWFSEGDSTPQINESTSPECRIGPPGYSPSLCHVMRYRENILKALAALVPFKDEYRKSLCEYGVVPYIIDSLKPRPRDAPIDPTSMPKNSAADGNPTPTLLAACGAARMLTRSVSVLRTSLIDGGVAQPLFTLLKHPDLDVQIAATAAICNLALDFSPMKEAIITSNIIPILCENAHSPNIKLRIESLWALKHVVYNSGNDIKMRVVDALSPTWLHQVMTQDPVNALARRGQDDEMDQSTEIAMGRANSAGEQVDILNPVEDTNDSAGDTKMDDGTPSSKVTLDKFFPDARRQRKLVLHGNLEQSTQSRQDDIAVQEQTFDLIRNIICGTGAAEMIDYLFDKIGQDAMLDALADNLRPRSIPLPPHRDPSSRAIQVPREILVAVTAVLVHIAAGTPRHRQVLMSHGDLLWSLKSYFDHPSRDVRVSCVWLVINLIYEEDTTDFEGCRERAIKLKSLGIGERLSSLAEDPDLDIKERTKTAVHLLNKFG
ncbi:Armadillo [Penicillium chermesinum]|nr:Armadillo [Penicillium chermesinum]